jgi:hypothetical protein
MKKITETIANAFAQGRNKSLGNTATRDGAFYLHGNKIAEKREDGIYMSLAGWSTVTTRERLNGLASVLGLDARFTQKAFEPYLNGKRIEACAWHKVS